MLPFFIRTFFILKGEICTCVECWNAIRAVRIVATAAATVAASAYPHNRPDSHDMLHITDQPTTAHHNIQSFLRHFNLNIIKLVFFILFLPFFMLFCFFVILYISFYIFCLPTTLAIITFLSFRFLFFFIFFGIFHPFKMILTLFIMSGYMAITYFMTAGTFIFLLFPCFYLFFMFLIYIFSFLGICSSLFFLHHSLYEK